MITTIVISAVAVTVVIGVAVAVWSYIDTRRKYYDEYIGRKTN